MLTLALSSNEQEILAGLRPAVRDAAFALDTIFRRVRPPIVSALRTIAQERRKGFQTIRDTYYLWKKEGVLGCVDKRCAPELWDGSAKRSLTPAVIDYWLGMQLEYRGRDTALRACHSEFIRRWRAGKVPELPSDCAVHPTTGVPHGCDLRNLRRHTLTPYQKKAVQIGKHAAGALLPKVLTTRVGLVPGQYVEFDDQEHDVQVGFVGVNTKITRPRGFHTLDYASGCDTLQSFKPTILNPDGTRQALRQIDFEWFTIAYLTQVGYRPEGTIFMAERGTSKAGSAFLERMARATGGAIEWRDSGLHREPALAGLFHGPAKGNPRSKGARECWFRLFREECAALPAPTGKDRDHAPEGTAALERESRLLLAAMKAHPALAERLQLPSLRWHDFVDTAHRIVRLINSRTCHRLEGWEESGYTTGEWRFDLGSPWLPQEKFLALPDAQKQLFGALLAQEPRLWNNRLLSPAEVWEPAKPGLTRVSGSAVPILFGAEHARPERVEDDLSIVVQDQELSPTPLIYDAVLTNGRHLDRRQKLAVYLNHFAPETLEVCDETLRWLGTARRVQRLCRTDTEALHRRYGFARKVASEELMPVARNGAEITRRETDRHEHNARVLGAAGEAQDRADFGSVARAAQARPARGPIDADALDELGGAVTSPRLTPEPEAGSADDIFDL